ncbi:Olfactory receptor 2D3 [Heterocephalus glaber]|uniref:Olfactory receptor 2D3 n=1 Tax=Heterocephalus glaber TaxID=10181 RepID=G5BIA2_HETGA|nr:Olfactory receptor 2D3 [Heterocephalus glaber]
MVYNLCVAIYHPLQYPLIMKPSSVANWWPPPGSVQFQLSKIISCILQLSSATGRVKAFSTCSSQAIVVALFFESGIITYFRAKSKHFSSINKFLSLFYTIITPMFNPMIYALRNEDVLKALRKLVTNT